MRLLTFIASQEGALVPSEAAAHLGVSQALIESMIEELARLGYLAAPGAHCPAQSCRACKQCGAACQPSQIRLWALTEKGQTVLQSQIPT